MPPTPQPVPGRGADSTRSSVLVWDLPTRSFHWTLVVFVFMALATGDDDGFVFTLHLIAGYAVMGLVVFRLAWGVIGSEHALFADFVRPWRVIREYAARVFTLEPHRSLGHNPLGGWMVVAMLAILAALVATGLFSGDEDAAGPFARVAGPWLADALGEVHEGLQGLLWAMIAIHVAGVVLESLMGGENLVRAMWTGRKPDPQTFAVAAADIRPVAAWRLLLAITVAAAAVTAVVA